MLFTDKRRILIKHYPVDNDFGAKSYMDEFSNKPWILRCAKELVKKIKERQAGLIEGKGLVVRGPSSPIL